MPRLTAGALPPKRGQKKRNGVDSFLCHVLQDEGSPDASSLAAARECPPRPMPEKKKKTNKNMLKKEEKDVHYFQKNKKDSTPAALISHVSSDSKYTECLHP